MSHYDTDYDHDHEYDTDTQPTGATLALVRPEISVVLTGSAVAPANTSRTIALGPEALAATIAGLRFDADPLRVERLALGQHGIVLTYRLSPAQMAQVQGAGADRLTGQVATFGADRLQLIALFDRPVPDVGALVADFAVLANARLATLGIDARPELTDAYGAERSMVLRAAGPPELLAAAAASMRARVTVEVTKEIDFAAVERALGATGRVFTDADWQVVEVVKNEVHRVGDNKGHAVALVQEAVEWTKKGKPIPSHSREVPIATLLNLGARSVLPQLDELVVTPQMLADGRILQDPGYDREAKLYYAPKNAYRRVSDEPTEGEVAEAKAILANLFRGCSFCGDAHGREQHSRAAAYSALFTAMARHGLRVRPFHLINGTVASSGKTTLLEMIYAATFGERKEVESLDDDPAEFERKIGMAIKAREPVCLNDNCGDGKPIGSPKLAAIATGETYGTRMIGTSDKIRGRPPLILFSGINLSTKDTLDRRTICCLLGHKPSEGRNPAEDARKAHPQIVWASLTIMRAYAILPNAAKVTTKPKESFEAWDKLVRQAVMWIGVGDPDGNLVVLRRDDETRELRRALLTEWRGAFPQLEGSPGLPVWVRPGAVAERAQARPGLAEALERIIGTQVKNFNSQAVSNALRRFVGQPYAGLALEASKGSRTTYAVTGLFDQLASGERPCLPPVREGDRPSPGCGFCAVCQPWACRTVGAELDRDEGASRDADDPYGED